MGKKKKKATPKKQKAAAAPSKGNGVHLRGAILVDGTDGSPTQRNTKLATALLGYLNPLPIAVIEWSPDDCAWKVLLG